MTVYETTMQAILARLGGRRPVVTNVRRSHKTSVPRDNAPAVYLAEAASDDVDGEVGNCDTRRKCSPVVRVFVRDDDGYAAMDTIIAAVVARLSPDAADVDPYPAGVVVELGSIATDEEIADGDALRKDLTLDVRYTAPYWTLGP